MSGEDLSCALPVSAYNSKNTFMIITHKSPDEVIFVSLVSTLMHTHIIHVGDVVQ